MRKFFLIICISNFSSEKGSRSGFGSRKISNICGWYVVYLFSKKINKLEQLISRFFLFQLLLFTWLSKLLWTKRLNGKFRTLLVLQKLPLNSPTNLWFQELQNYFQKISNLIPQSINYQQAKKYMLLLCFSLIQWLGREILIRFIQFLLRCYTYLNWIMDIRSYCISFIQVKSV